MPRETLPPEIGFRRIEGLSKGTVRIPPDSDRRGSGLSGFQSGSLTVDAQWPIGHVGGVPITCHEKPERIRKAALESRPRPIRGLRGTNPLTVGQLVVTVRKCSGLRFPKVTLRR